MKERPIILSGKMVRAILEGKKTQTRRVIQPQPKPQTYDCVNLKEAFPNNPWCWIADWLKPDGSVMSYDEWREPHGGCPDCSEQFACPYGVPGDRLWVREAWLKGWPAVGGELMQYDDDGIERSPELWYRATPPKNFMWLDDNGSLKERIPWKSSIHMPRWASRITLEITEVRVQRLQDISDEDAKAEGGWGGLFFYRSFAGLWDSINAKRGFGWAINPWVWVVGFKRVKDGYA